MNEPNHHIEHISAEQIEYYLAGVLSRREMHSIERHILDCEFCKEAMDGYEVSQIDIGNDITDLKSQLSNKVGVKEAIPQPDSWFATYRNYGIAAIITLLFVSIYFVFDLQKDTVTKVAQSEKSVPKSDVQVEDTTLIASNEVEEAPPPTENITQATEVAPSESRATTPVIANRAEDVRDSFEAEDPEIVALQATGEGVGTSSGASGETAITEEIPIETDDQAFADEEAKAFTADAFDEDFDLEEVVQPTIVLSKPSEESATENTLDDLQVEALRKRAQTSSQSSLERSAQSVVSPIRTKEAEPEGGLSQYLKTLQLEMKYPDEAFRQGIQGDVEVSFTVEVTGQLSNVSIAKSLGSGCDEEAIRLLTEGPAWLPAESDGSSVSSVAQITIAFKLDN